MSLKFMFLRTVSLCLVVLGVGGAGSVYESTALNDLQAECRQEGIKVKLFFKQPFSGVAYSNGHYETRQCRYISQEDGDAKPSGTNFSFLIPINECGTVYHGGLGSPLSRSRTTRDANNAENQVYIENTLLIQNDPTIQESGDLAKTIRCVWQKEIHKPLVASLPFGNVKSKLTPLRFPSTDRERVGSSDRNRTNYATFNKGRLRFQMKGQVQSVPTYRRHHQARSLPFLEVDSDESAVGFTSQSPTIPVFEDDDEAEDQISALPLQGDRMSSSHGFSTRIHSRLLFFTKLALTLTISLMISIL